MKRYFFYLMFMVMFSVCMNDRQAEAYSVTVEEGGIYAEVIPPHILKNAAPLFKKHVRKAMKYYDKYKDADAYTYAIKIPDTYRDFIEVAKKIQDSDQIVIKNPFYIYYFAGEEVRYQYYFSAEQNHKKLCVFSIDVYVENGDTVFTYDKMVDQYSWTDGNADGEQVFYRIGDVIYAETPEKVRIVRDMTPAGIKMESDSIDTKKQNKAFYRKKYEEKKDQILTYLDEVKEGKVEEKSNENMKLDLKEEYIQPDDTPETEKKGKAMYVAVCAGILCVLCVFAAMLIIKKKKRA